MEMENLDTLDYRDYFFITFAGSLCSLLVIFSNIYLRLGLMYRCMLPLWLTRLVD